MSELGELFSILREEGKIKRAKNLENSIEILRNKKIDFTKLSDTHLRIGEYDFWPSTGLFIHRPTKKRGRGVFTLINRMENKE